MIGDILKGVFTGNSVNTYGEGGAGCPVPHAFAHYHTVRGGTGERFFCPPPAMRRVGGRFPYGNQVIEVTRVKYWPGGPSDFARLEWEARVVEEDSSAPAPVVTLEAGRVSPVTLQRVRELAAQLGCQPAPQDLPDHCDPAKDRFECRLFVRGETWEAAEEIRRKAEATGVSLELMPWPFGWAPGQEWPW